MSAQTINIVINLLGVLLGGGAIGMVLRFMNKRQELHNADVADIRDHYAAELAALREKLNSQEEHFQRMEMHWREMLENSDRRHEECEKTRAELRRELDKMHTELAGLQRQIASYSSDQLLVMEREADPRPPSERAPEATAAAGRVKDIVEKKNGNGK